MEKTDKVDKGDRFSASKRDFLKKAALMGIYVGPMMKSVEMAAIRAKPTGPPPKKKPGSSGSSEEPTQGQVMRLSRKGRHT